MSTSVEDEKERVLPFAELLRFEGHGDDGLAVEWLVSRGLDEATAAESVEALGSLARSGSDE